MESVEISSKGGAAARKAASLGTYVKTDQLSQGYPVYQKDAEGESYFLFVNPYGDWIVSQRLHDPHAVLKNSITKPTPKIPPRNNWFYEPSDQGFLKGSPASASDNNLYAEDNTIEVVAKVGGQQSGNTAMERFLIKCGLEKYVASWSKLGITMDALREVHRAFAYYPDRDIYEQTNIFEESDVSLEDCLIMRKRMQEEQDNGSEEKDLDPTADLSDENLPNFPTNMATVNHGKPVTAVTFFGDVGYLFTGGVGGTVRLWNMSTSMPPPFSINTRSGPDFRIPPPFSVSPHSRKFYTPIIEYNLGGSDSVFQPASDYQNVVTCMKPVMGRMTGLLVGGSFQGRKSIQFIIFNNSFPPTNQAFAEMGYYTKKCLDMAVSPNYKTLYCCFEDVLEEDKNVEIWDIQLEKLGERVGVLEGHEAGVTFVKISADGTKLWTAGRDKTVRLWDLETKTQLQKYDLGEDVAGLACSPKEDLAVATTGPPSTVIVMRAGSSAVEKILSPEDLEFSNERPLVFSPSGSWFLSLGKGVFGCAAPTGPKLFTFHGERVFGPRCGDTQDVVATCGAFHPEGTFFAVGTTNESAEDKYRVEILNCSKKTVVSGYDSDSD